MPTPGNNSQILLRRASRADLGDDLLIKSPTPSAIQPTRSAGSSRVFLRRGRATISFPVGCTRSCVCIHAAGNHTRGLLSPVDLHYCGATSPVYASSLARGYDRGARWMRVYTKSTRVEPRSTPTEKVTGRRRVKRRLWICLPRTLCFAIFFSIKCIGSARRYGLPSWILSRPVFGMFL